VRFRGKVALVTGASSGIGLAVAERLGAEGAQLVIVGAPEDAGDLERAADGLRARGVELEHLTADISEEIAAREAIELAGSRFGQLDVLVNNAGVAYSEEILETPVEHLDRTLAVNVRGTFLMAREGAAVMQPGSAIVNTASTASVLGEELQVTYNASKGAVAALTRSLAVDLAPRRIRVNAVAPGWVETRMTRVILDDPEQWSKHRTRIPLDRAGSPAEIAAVHAFLASDDAAYVTGAVVMADGGLTAGYRFSNWHAAPPVPAGALASPGRSPETHEPRP
jgi:NAD(P)-dependent dehydrogenase (short-subunit alcohol dehydrogenase family)